MLHLTVRRLAAAVLALALSSAVRAQDVLVCWGDSILAGYNPSGDTTTPYGPAPFGDPVPGAYRWDAASGTWGPVTPYQNHFGTSADPVYGLVAGWRRFHGGDVYVIAHAVAGSDASPAHPNPAASWAPQVAGGAFERFLQDHLTPALATLPGPTLSAVLFTAGNNLLSATFEDDVDAVNAAIAAQVPQTTPSFLGIKTYLGTPNDAQTLLQRAAIDRWVARSPRHHAVETVSIPARTGGLADGYHLSHFGSIFLGYWAAVTEFFQL